MSTPNDPFVTIVTLNWNGKRFIDPFMESFKKINYPKDRLELIFADNDSSDGSVEYIKDKYKDIKSLKVVQNGGNYGYAGGNNRAMKHAKGAYILVCNNDLTLDKNIVKELLKTAKKYDAAVTVPKLMFKNKPGYINNAGSELQPDNDWPIREIGIGKKDSKKYSTEREITAFCGACVLFTREFLHKVGLFDAKFFMYFEDGDLSWRGQKAGYKFYFSPKALAYHEHTGTSKEGSPLFNHFVGRNRLLILVKHAGFIVFLKGLKRTLADHLWLRLKNILKAAKGEYGKKQSLIEFYRSQKMLWAFLFMAPGELFKRWHIAQEEKL